MKYVWILIFVFCTTLTAEEKIDMTGEKRDSALKRARVWKSVDIPKMNILAGPQNDVSVPFESTIECDYVEPKEKLTGVWPKFLCKLKSGHIVRTKYGTENKEIYAEAAATRLFWALGFYADEVYPVQVKCRGCPENPFKPTEGNRGTFFFKDALMERNFAGEPIEEKGDQGWTWKELEKVDPKEGGSPRTEIDALRLLAAFVQHVDAKPDNQRLACYKEDIKDPDHDGKAVCDQPILMVQDLGATFGAGQGPVGISRIDLKGWKSNEIWNTAREAKTREKTGIGYCIANITTSYLSGEEGLTDPVITEEGRKFLADLLNQLSDQQITDLFRVARVEMVDNGKVTLNDWVSVFKEKRAAVQDRKCSQE
jgi:hypothetical protein